MDKWLKRDKKLRTRRELRSIRYAMSDKEPRRKKRRHKSHDEIADEEWRFNLSSKEGS